MSILAMYQRHRFVKRLTLLLLFISATLWTTRIVHLYWPRCRSDGIRVGSSNSLTPAKGVELDPSIQNITSWFEYKLRKLPQSTVQTACNATATITESYHHHLHSPTEGTNYFATLTAIGKLHTKLGNGSGQGWDFDKLLSGISGYIQDGDGTLTSLADGVSNSEETANFNSLHGLGVSIVSLASEPISQLAVETESVQHTTRALEAAEIKWFGLNAKKHHILTVNRQRIGCLAFCAVHGMCTESSRLPFGPVKYSNKVATTTVNELKSHGVNLIIVLVYWGWRTSIFPDEMALPVARHLASLGVDVIIGYHPNGVQGHAYMGKTLILFSLGHILSSDSLVSYCWNKVSNNWRYSLAKECQEVPPAARDTLHQREMHTRIYQIHLSNSYPAMAEYVTLPLKYREDKVRSPIDTGSRQNWTTVCGMRDNYCLSCDHF